MASDMRIFLGNIVSRRIMCFCVLGLLLISLLANATSTSAQTTANPSTFRVGWGGTPFDTFNPFTTYTVLSEMAWLDVYSFLLRFDQSFQPVVPDLAYNWTISPISSSESVATFNLVKNATWSDGVPVTSQDVLYSYQVANNSASRVEPFLIPVISITAPDNYTVIFHYKPVAIFMSMTIAQQIAIVPAHVWKKYVPDPSNATQLGNYQDYPLVGCGPFTVTNYVQGQYIELTSNPNYFYTARTPHFQRIILQFFKDPNSMIAALEAGQIDAAAPSILPAQVSALKKGYPDINVAVEPGAYMMYIAINIYPYGHGNPTLKDLRVRLALADAINMTELAQVIWQGYATPAGGLNPLGNIYYDPYLKPYLFDLNLANRILDDAGYKRGPDGIRVSPSGTRLSYNFYVISSWPEEIQAARIIASWWKQIGVEAIVTPEDGGALSAIIWPDFKQDFDLWDWEQTPALPTLLSVFMSNQIETGTSDSGMNDSSYDALYNQMMAAPTQQQVLSDAYQLQNILYQQLPYINLYYLKSVQAYDAKTVTGFELHQNMTGGPFNEFNWYTFLDVAPVSAVTTSSMASSATSIAPSVAVNYTLVGIAALVIVIVIAIVAVALRRRTKGAK
jgi:peptide/nickel transport system substrate-binding protein